MVVAVTVVREVQMAVHQVAGVVAMGNGLVAATRSVNMVFLVAAAVMPGRALVGILGGDFDGVVLHVAAVFLMVKVSVVQIVDVVPVLDGGVAAALAVIMVVMIAVMTHTVPPFLPIVL